MEISNQGNEMTPNQITYALSKASGTTSGDVYHAFERQASAYGISFIILFAVVTALWLLTYSSLKRWSNTEHAMAKYKSGAAVAWFLYIAFGATWVGNMMYLVPKHVAAVVSPQAVAYEKFLYHSKQFSGTGNHDWQQLIAEAAIVEELEAEVDRASKILDEIRDDIVPPNPEIDYLLHDRK